jgi:hypothetical protein
MAIYSLFSRESFDIHLGYVERNSRTKKKLFFPHGNKFKKSFLYQITKGINIKNLIIILLGKIL